MKIRKNDNVVVIAGKYKGKTGKVIEVLVDEDKVCVEGVNMIKRHYKASQAHPEGGIVEKCAPISVSNVEIIDPSDNKGTRIGYKFIKDDNSGKQKKVRISKRTGEILDK